MVANPVILRNTAWILALIFAILGIMLIFFMFALSAPPWTAGGIFLTLVYGGSYVIGLLIGKKWPLTGGIMSLILPLSGLIETGVTLIILESGSESLGYLVSTIIMYLTMMIPGLLYLLSWYLEKKADQNESIGERSK